MVTCVTVNIYLLIGGFSRHTVGVSKQKSKDLDCGSPISKARWGET